MLQRYEVQVETQNDGVHSLTATANCVEAAIRVALIDANDRWPKQVKGYAVRMLPREESP